MENLEDKDQTDVSSIDSSKILKENEEFGRFFYRAGAYLVDLFIAVFSGWFTIGVFVTLFLPEMFDSFFDTVSRPVDKLLSLSMLIIFNTLSLTLWSTTPGKMLYGLRVVDMETGQKINAGQAIRRSVSYILSSLFFGIGFFYIFFNKERQAWHDKIAGTAVIRQKEKKIWWGVAILCILFGLYIFFNFLSVSVEI